MDIFRKRVKPYLDFDGKDVWRCNNCTATLFHPSYTEPDRDEMNYIKYCSHCGRRVNWDERIVPAFSTVTEIVNTIRK